MIDTRLIIVEGLPGTEGTRLAQQIKIALEHAGIAHQWVHPQQAGHPLRRDFDAGAYGSADDYAAALLAQWRNFTLRAEAEGELWLFDSLLLPLQHEHALADALLDALAPLQPVLLYLWRDAPDDAGALWLRQRDAADDLFARREERRALLNASRASEDELLEDALTFLSLPSPAPQTASDRARVSGTWRSAAGPGTTPMRVESAEAGLVAHAVPGAPDPDARRLLPAGADRYLVAGEALELTLAGGEPDPVLRVGVLDPRADFTPVLLRRDGPA